MSSNTIYHLVIGALLLTAFVLFVIKVFLLWKKDHLIARDLDD